MGFCTALALILLVLKLVGVIAISWGWIIFIAAIPFILFILFVAIGAWLNE